MNDKLLKALDAGLEDLKQLNKSKTEIDFIKKHWNMFCNDKYYFYNTLKSLENKDGNSLISLLGVKNTYIDKIKAEDLRQLYMDPTNSKPYKMFLKQAKVNSSLTFIFVVSTSAVIVTNVYGLDNLNGCRVYSVVKSQGKLPNIYISSISNLKELKLYA